MLRFLAGNARLLTAGFFFAFASSFGQTFFIALFAVPLRSEFSLSHGDFGGIYTIATLGSAVALIWIGKYADQLGMRTLGVISLGCLGAMCVAMAAMAGPLMLVLVIFGLRLFGQGMLSHLSATSMARWFHAYRGRALSLAGMGFPAGAAIFPFVAVALTEALGWRQAWVAGAAFLTLCGIPLVLALLRTEPPLESDVTAGRGTEAAAPKRQWTRGEVLRDPVFYLLLPGVLAPAFITTAVFFHQAHLVEAKGWSLAWFAATYPVYAVATVVGSLAGGWAVDRWGSTRLIAAYLLPLAVSVLLLGAIDTPAVAVAYMLLSGAATGAGRSITSALWAELYGTRHLGGIRALAVSGMVLASALGPGVTGWALDLFVTFDTQLAVMGLYALAGALASQVLVRRLKVTAAT